MSHLGKPYWAKYGGAMRHLNLDLILAIALGLLLADLIRALVRRLGVKW